MKKQIRKKIQNYSYCLSDLLYFGTQSTIFYGLNDLNKQTVIVKVINLKNCNTYQFKHVQTQIKTIKSIHHPNIVCTFDIFRTINNCYIIQQFCNQGDLKNIITKRSQLTQIQSIHIFRNIILGYTHLHKLGYLHLNLDTSNIFLKNNVAKIGDFSRTHKIQPQNKITLQQDTIKQQYRAPEALQHSTYSEKSDVWCLGLILYEMVHGRLPWIVLEGENLLQKMLKNSYTIISNLSENLKDFIRKCLILDPNKRISVDKFAQHPFIVDIMNYSAPLLMRQPTNLEQSQPSSNDISRCKSCNKIDSDIEGQIHWMQFLYKFLTLFPDRQYLQLKFIVIKQFLIQFNVINSLLFQGDNVLGIEGWQEYINQENKINFFKSILNNYKELKINILNEYTTLLQNLKHQTLNGIMDKTFLRSEYLSIISINLTLSICRNIWRNIEEQKPKIIFLDYLCTYNQLNCLLIDNFHNISYFQSMSKLKLIINIQPIILQSQHLHLLHHKLLLLNIIHS